MSEKQGTQKKGIMVKLSEKFPSLKKLKNVKNIEVVIALVFLSIALLIYFSNFSNNSSSESSFNSIEYTSNVDYVTNLKIQMEESLSCIKGVGDVSVVLALSAGSELVIASSTEEKTVTTTSGLTTTMVNEPIIINKSGQSEPIVLSEVLPTVLGVIVVAEGADDVRVRLDLITAVKTLLDIPVENIEVFAGE